MELRETCFVKKKEIKCLSDIENGTEEVPARVAAHLRLQSSLSVCL